MRCINFLRALSSAIVEALSREGYNVSEFHHRWGVELSIEGGGGISTVCLYPREDRVVVEVSGYGMGEGYNVDIFDCECDCSPDGIRRCMNALWRTLSGFLGISKGPSP